jgi:hypothetical protein
MIDRAELLHRRALIAAAHRQRQPIILDVEPQPGYVEDNGGQFEIERREPRLDYDYDDFGRDD